MYQEGRIDHVKNIAWLCKLPNFVLQPITDEVNEIKNNFLTHKSQDASFGLAGNIKNEYWLKNNWDLVEKVVLDQLKQWDNSCDNTIIGENSRKLGITHSDLKLNSLWVNYQSKFEFNPIHCHNGLYSFVIWLDIPYTLEEERQRLPNVRINLCGQFSFITESGDDITLEVDKSYNGTMALFRASQLHQVYPFYTSDNYRITVAGNLTYK